MAEEIISISVPPFPDFIEGNFRTLRKGQSHPQRTGLGYFDLLMVQKGTLFLQEEGTDYTIREKECFILLPDGHHCSWKACEEETSFYWIHFYTTAPWKQDVKPAHFVSDLPIPELHFHQCSYTLHLPKQAELEDAGALSELIRDMLESTVPGHAQDIWRTEELFLRLLRMLENQRIYRDRLTLLAEQVHAYLEKNMADTISNALLEKQFHLHSNYIARATKATFGKTPLELLMEIRMEYAKKYLLRSSYSLAAIAEIIGFHSEIYFSSCFRKYAGVSPREYRRSFDGKRKG